MRCLPCLTLASALMLAGGSKHLEAAEVTVANPSFELPTTDGSDVRVESWEELPQPDWFVETAGQTWDQLAGTFRPTPAQMLENLHGEQALYLFALPQVGIFQNLAAGGSPITFVPGQSYQMNFAVAGAATLKPGASLTASFYYTDSNGKPLPVAQATVVHSPEVFAQPNRFVDFSLNVPVVAANDAWAGKQIGLLFTSTATSELAGGRWAMDNVRVSTTEPAAPLELKAARQGNNLRVSWQSVAGARYQLQATGDLQMWVDRGEPLEGTGSELSQILSLSEWQFLFLRLRQLPLPTISGETATLKSSALR